MAVPHFEQMLRPVLVALEDGRDHSPDDIRDAVAQHFELTPQDLEEPLPSGGHQTRYENMRRWALVHLGDAGLIAKTATSGRRITDRGRAVLAEHPTLSMGDLREMSPKPTGAWDEFLDTLAELRQAPDFDARERDYKLEIAQLLANALIAARDGGDYQAALEVAFRSHGDGWAYNLTNWRQNDWLLSWAGQDESRVREALSGFLRTDMDALPRFQAFSKVSEQAELSGATRRNRAGTIAFGSLFNFAVEPLALPLVRSRVFAAAERAVAARVPAGSSVAEEYAHHLTFAEQTAERLRDLDVPVRDMLDVQSLLFLYSYRPAAADEVDHSEDVLNSDPLSAAIHLVVKWSERFGANTVDEHHEMADEHGSAWWGLIGSAERPRLAGKWVEAIQAQLDAGTPTIVYISGPTCWSTTLRGIATSRDDVDETLIPAYYPSGLEHNLWVRLSDFEAIDRAWLTEHLELVSAPGRPLAEGVKAG